MSEPQEAEDAADDPDIDPKILEHCIATDRVLSKAQRWIEKYLESEKIRIKATERIIKELERMLKVRRMPIYHLKKEMKRQMPIVRQRAKLITLRTRARLETMKAKPFKQPEDKGQ